MCIRDRLPFTPQEIELLSLAGGFLAASLRLAERQDVQAEALESLSAERVAVQTRRTALSEALVEAEAREAGLLVFALGPLRVEQGGVPLRHWGGAKAGRADGQDLGHCARRDDNCDEMEVRRGRHIAFG